MTKMKKSSYATPIIKVVSFIVEEGFQGTKTNVYAGDDTDIQQMTNGSTAFDIDNGIF